MVLQVAKFHSFLWLSRENKRPYTEKEIGITLQVSDVLWTGVKTRCLCTMSDFVNFFLPRLKSVKHLRVSHCSMSMFLNALLCY